MCSWAIYRFVHKLKKDKRIMKVIFRKQVNMVIQYPYVNEPLTDCSFQHKIDFSGKYLVMPQTLQTIEWSRVRILLRPFGNFGNFLYPTLPVSFGRDTKSRRSLLSGVYARGSKISHQYALEMCTVVDSTTHSNPPPAISLTH